MCFCLFCSCLFLPKPADATTGGQYMYREMGLLTEGQREPPYNHMFLMCLVDLVRRCVYAVASGVAMLCDCVRCISSETAIVMLLLCCVIV